MSLPLLLRALPAAYAPAGYKIPADAWPIAIAVIVLIVVAYVVRRAVKMMAILLLLAAAGAAFAAYRFGLFGH